MYILRVESAASESLFFTSHSSIKLTTDIVTDSVGIAFVAESFLIF